MGFSIDPHEAAQFSSAERLKAAKDRRKSGPVTVRFVEPRSKIRASDGEPATEKQYEYLRNLIGIKNFLAVPEGLTKGEMHKLINKAKRKQMRDKAHARGGVRGGGVKIVTNHMAPEDRMG